MLAAMLALATCRDILEYGLALLFSEKLGRNSLSG